MARFFAREKNASGALGPICTLYNFDSLLISDCGENLFNFDIFQIVVTIGVRASTTSGWTGQLRPWNESD